MKNTPTKTVSLLGSAALGLILLVPLATAQRPATRVEATPAIVAPLEHRLSLSGSLRAPRLSALSAQIDGYVTQIDLQAGDRVKAGQVLVELDRRLPELELNRLQAVEKEARTLLADQSRRASEARNLMDDNNFSRSEFETLQAERSAREARLLQIQAELEKQRTRVDYHTVKAPFSGVVTRRLAQPGQRVSGATPLLELASMDPIWAEVQLPEQYLGRVHTGGTMQLQSAADNAQWLAATLTRVVPVTSSGTRTFLVRAELANPDWQLAPGMSIRVQLPLDGGAEEPVLQVPQDAVSRLSSGETRLWVVIPGSPTTVEARSVKLGRRSGSLVEILSGRLSADEQVVTRGNEALREGQTVVLTRGQGAN